MASFGERMRREREMRGITLAAISEKTKITTRTLEALEKDDFDKLPGGIFNKGFVRSYAQFLGMNEEQVLKDFIEAAGDPEQVLPLPDPPVKRQEIPQPKERRSWTSVAIPAVAAMIVLGVGWKMIPKMRRLSGTSLTQVVTEKSDPGHGSSTAYAATAETTQTPPNAPVQPTAVTPPLQAPSTAATLQSVTQTTTGTAAGPQLVPTSAPSARSDRFVILVKAMKPAWVSITADGKPVIEGELKRKKKIRAYSQVILKTNNAGALAFSRNGQPLQPLGPQDQQATVTFTPDGIAR